MEDWTKLTKKEWWPMLECIFLAIIVTFIEKYHLLLAKNQQLFITKVMVLEEILMFSKIMEDIDQNIILDNQETDYLKIVWEMSNKVLLSISRILYLIEQIWLLIWIGQLHMENKFNKSKAKFRKIYWKD